MITQIVAGLSIASMADARMQSFLGTSGSMKEMAGQSGGMRKKGKVSKDDIGLPTGFRHVRHEEGGDAFKLPKLIPGHELKKATQQDGTGATGRNRQKQPFIPLKLPLQASNTEQIDMEKLKEEMNQKLKKTSAPTKIFSIKNGGGLMNISTEPMEQAIIPFQRKLTVRLVKNGEELAERAEEAEAKQAVQIKQVIQLVAGDDFCLPTLVNNRNPAGSIPWDLIRTKENLQVTECQCRSERCYKGRHTFCMTLLDGESGICM